MGDRNFHRVDFARQSRMKYNELILNDPFMMCDEGWTRILGWLNLCPENLPLPERLMESLETAATEASTVTETVMSTVTSPAISTADVEKLSQHHQNGNLNANSQTLRIWTETVSIDPITSYVPTDHLFVPDSAIPTSPATLPTTSQHHSPYVWSDGPHPPTIWNAPDWRDFFLGMLPEPFDPSHCLLFFLLSFFVPYFLVMGFFRELISLYLFLFREYPADTYHKWQQRNRERARRRKVSFSARKASSPDRDTDNGNGSDGHDDDNRGDRNGGHGDDLKSNADDTKDYQKDVGMDYDEDIQKDSAETGSRIHSHQVATKAGNVYFEHLPEDGSDEDIRVMASLSALRQKTYKTRPNSILIGEQDEKSEQDSGLAQEESIASSSTNESSVEFGASLPENLHNVRKDGDDTLENSNESEIAGDESQENSESSQDDSIFIRPADDSGLKVDKSRQRDINVQEEHVLASQGHGTVLKQQFTDSIDRSARNKSGTSEVDSVNDAAVPSTARTAYDGVEHLDSAKLADYAITMLRNLAETTGNPSEDSLGARVVDLIVSKPGHGDDEVQQLVTRGSAQSGSSRHSKIGSATDEVAGQVDAAEFTGLDIIRIADSSTEGISVEKGKQRSYE